MYGNQQHDQWGNYKPSNEMSGTMNLYEILRAEKVESKEGHLPLIISYYDPDIRRLQVAQGTMFPVYRGKKIDIKKLISDQLPSNLNFRKMYIYVKNLKLLILDDSGFMCACLLHYKSDQKDEIINIYLDDCEP